MQPKSWTGLFAIMGMLLMITACVGRAYLIVDYQVPTATPQLKGQTVKLTIKDKRLIKDVLSPGAAQHFTDFEGRYSLAWVMPENQRVLAGEYPLNGLIHKAVTKRLEQLGATVTDRADADTAHLTVTLIKLNVNQLSMKWYSEMTCEAHLTSANQHTATEKVTGSAERMRVVGRKGADTVLSQIFSDVLNRIDMVKLFQNAKLI